jgi:hypothetical protein
LTNQYPLFTNFREVTISNHPGNGKQIIIEVTHETGMKNDFSDLRFSDASAAIPYWIMDPTTGNPSSVSVMIKLTAATTIFKHWGKSDATSESNPEAVCLLYDDFTGTVLDTNKWTVIAKDGDGNNIESTVTLSDSNAVIAYKNTYAGAEGLTTVDAYPAGIDIHFRSKVDQLVNYNVSIGDKTKPQSDYYGTYSGIRQMVLGGGYSWIYASTATAGEFRAEDGSCFPPVLRDRCSLFVGDRC